MAWALSAAVPDGVAPGQFVDDARYAVLAKSLRTGAGYRALNLPGQPNEVKFPPLWPAALAVVWSPAGSDRANLTRLALVNRVLIGGVAALLAVLALNVTGVSALGATALAVAGVAAPMFASLWVIPLSEPLALLLVAAGLVLVCRDQRGAALACLVAAVYTRSISIAFVVGALTWWGWTLRGKAWKLVGAAVVGVLPWLVWQAWNAPGIPPGLTGFYDTYGHWYADALRAEPATVLGRVPLMNVRFLMHGLGSALAGSWFGGPWILPAALGVGVVALIVRGRREAPVLAAGLACYALITLLWPFPSARFLGGIWPLILVAALAGLPRPWRMGGAGAAAVVALALWATGDAWKAHLRRAVEGEQFAREAGAVLPPDAVVASTNPAYHYLVLGHQAVPVARMRSYEFYRLGHWATSWGTAGDLRGLIAHYRPSHILIERRGSEGRYAAGRLMVECPEMLDQAWASPGAEYVLRVQPDAPCDLE